MGGAGESGIGVVLFFRAVAGRVWVCGLRCEVRQFISLHGVSVFLRRSLSEQRANLYGWLGAAALHRYALRHESASE